MKCPLSFQLDVEKGTLIVTDGNERSVQYRRDDGPVAKATQPHAILDDHGGMATTPLVDAHDFPSQLVVRHKAPNPPGHVPVPDKGKWESDYLYVKGK